MSTDYNASEIDRLVREGREQCCFVGPSAAECKAAANYWIGGATRRPDDYVYACADHVDDLRRDGDDVVRMDK